jgi:hypothetical protein
MLQRVTVGAQHVGSLACPGLLTAVNDSSLAFACPMACSQLLRLAITPLQLPKLTAWKQIVTSTMPQWLHCALHNTCRTCPV